MTGTFWVFIFGLFPHVLVVAHWALSVSLFMTLPPPPHPWNLPTSFALDGTSTMDAIQLLLFLSWCCGSHFFSLSLSLPSFSVTCPPRFCFPFPPPALIFDPLFLLFHLPPFPLPPLLLLPRPQVLTPQIRR